MKFLLDTNVIIPLEPTNDGTEESLAEEAASFHSFAVAAGHQVYTHAAVRQDIKRDKLQWRNELRQKQLKKYPVLRDPPAMPQHLLERVGTPAVGTNDWVDNQLLAAVVCNAVDYLVTEDTGLHRKAKRIGLSERLIRVREASTLISDLSDSAPLPPPAVRSVPAYVLNPEDPIFASFRDDYPGFDEWLGKCQKQHRQSWIIENPDGKLAGIVIVNPEDKPEAPMSGRVLKICTMKVSEGAFGFRYGELLLKAVFEYAHENRYDWLFVTAFAKHTHLIQLVEDFGFTVVDKRTGLGELIFAKSLRPAAGAHLSLPPLEYHIQYGPHAVSPDIVDWFVIPILPRYSSILFPETEDQLHVLNEPRPYGNAIRKAYLCHANIREIQPGSLLFFYRSEVEQGLVAMGVAEEMVRSAVPEEIARAVGRRTVYNLDQIRQMCDKPVLAILFRQARIFHPAVRTTELTRGGVFSTPPQSITRIPVKGKNGCGLASGCSASSYPASLRHRDPAWRKTC